MVSCPLAASGQISRLTRDRGKSGRVRVGNARKRHRNRRNIGPLLVAPALMCGGRERAKQHQIGIAHTRPRLKEDRELALKLSQWLRGSAVGMKQRVRGISGLPCPSQEQGNRYCDVLMASQSVSLSVAHFAPHRAKCAFSEPIRKPIGRVHMRVE